MKKLLGVSIAAMLAVVPMMANATNPAAATTESTPYTGVALDQTANIATTSYVQGGFNAAVGMVNDTYNAKQDNLVNDATPAAAISSTVKTTVQTDVASASDEALVTEKAIATALNNITTNAQTATQVEDAIDAAAGAGLVTDNSGTLSIGAGDGIAVANDAVSVDVTANKGLGFDTNDRTLEVLIDNSTIQFNNNGQLTVPTGSLSSASIDPNALASGSGDYASDTDLTTQGYVDEAIDTAVSDKATQAGVTNTIGLSTVDVYTTWNSTAQNTIQTVAINAANYAEPVAPAPEPEPEP